eukprot:TRINITY_DN8373_c0_g1_i5.p1 TRINITY_DN8373_c0_g1~~TRINITY_DN8373_c0_g1_i5.p1  ORF type:complete len:289 (-),score=76.04 TRINITY_DN8373_c0_g1_i5:519-1385(-)
MEQQHNSAAEHQAAIDKLGREHADHLRGLGGQHRLEIQALKTAAEDAERQAEEARADAAALAKLLEVAKDECRLLQTKLSAAETRNQKLCAEKDKLSEQVRSISLQMDVMEEENSRLQAHMVEQAAQLSALKQEESAAKAESKAVGCQAREAETSAQDLAGRVASIGAELERCTESCENMRQYLLNHVASQYSAQLKSCGSQVERRCIEASNLHNRNMLQRQYEAFSRIFARFSSHVQQCFAHSPRIDPTVGRRAAGPLAFESPHSAGIDPVGTVLRATPSTNSATSH